MFALFVGEIFDAYRLAYFSDLFLVRINIDETNPTTYTNTTGRHHACCETKTN